MTILTAPRPAGIASHQAAPAGLVHAIAEAALRAIAIAAIVAVNVVVVLALTGALSGPARSSAPIPAPERWAAPAPVTPGVDPGGVVEPTAPGPGAAPAIR